MDTWAGLHRIVSGSCTGQACETKLLWDDGTAFNYSALEPVVTTVSMASASVNDVTVALQLNYNSLLHSTGTFKLTCSRPCNAPQKCYQFALTPYSWITAPRTEAICGRLNQTTPMLKNIADIREFVRWMAKQGL